MARLSSGDRHVDGLRSVLRLASVVSLDSSPDSELDEITVGVIIERSAEAYLDDTRSKEDEQREEPDLEKTKKNGDEGQYEAPASKTAQDRRLTKFQIQVIPIHPPEIPLTSVKPQSP